MSTQKALTELNNDQKVVQDGRKNALEGAEAPLRERSIEKLVKKLEKMNAGERVVEVWNSVNARRATWLERQRVLLQEYDEFYEDIYDKTQEWSSALHLPIALTHAKTYHARFLAALLGIDPPFTVKARQEANQDRSFLVQELMRYTLSSWCNENYGVEEEVDSWLWAWVTSGCGILKLGWDRKYSRYWGVSTKQMPGEDGQPQMVEVEEEITDTCFDGPMIQWVPAEDVAIDNGNGDPDKADSVIHSVMMTGSQLWTLADQGVFREKCVEEVIRAGEDSQSAEPAAGIKQDKAITAGAAELDSNTDLQRYQILEAHMKIDVDGSGIASDIILWVHKTTREILRATYLRRVMPTGRRPFIKIDFHRRHGEDYGVGIIELLYSLTKEIDAIHNMKIDNGLISSMPFGFYRPTASQNAEERLPMEPGTLIPLDSPQTDVHFPNLGNRTVFGFQEEAALNQSIERLTGISDMSLGVIGGQGAARTATGARALLGESNANLDVFLRRMNRGWKRVLIYLFQLLQQKIPNGLQFRVLGDDGNNYWAKIESKEELAGQWDFELDANSANSNKMVQIEQANSVLATVANPLYIQLGIVSPAEIYEALKNKFRSEGVRDFSKFIRKPSNMSRMFTPEEIANRVLAGVDMQLGPEQDLEGFIAYVQHIIDNDELLGQFNEEQTIALAMKMKEATAMMEALQQQAAQVANAQQVQTNAGLSTAPTQLPQGSTPNTPGTQVA